MRWMKLTRLTRQSAMVAVLLIANSILAHAMAGKRTDMNGVWILLGSKTENLKLTPAGEKARAAYDYQKDDPDMRCIPASFTRIMHTPSPPIEVRQRQDYVEINYEFMDVRRRVPLKKGLAVKDAPYAVREHPNMGRSVDSMTVRRWSLKLLVKVQECWTLSECRDYINRTRCARSNAMFPMAT